MCCKCAGTIYSDDEYNNGQLTLKKKQLLTEYGMNYRTIRNSSDHHNTDERKQSEQETPLKSMPIITLAINYGLHDKITIPAILPYAVLYTANSSDKGMDALMLLGTCSIHSKATFNLAAQAGIELPTGVQKGSRFDNTTIVVGSGSIDPIIGLAFSQHIRKLNLQGSVIYKYTVRGFENNYYGSLSVENMALAYTINHGQDRCSADSLTKKASGIGVNIFVGYH